MNEKQPKNEYTAAYQTGSAQMPKSHNGLIAFLLGLVIFLCGISTALGVMNVRLFNRLSEGTENGLNAVSFSDTGEPQSRDSSGQSVLGISGEGISDFWHTYHCLPQGIFIQAVDEGSEAAAKGICTGDILVRINGTAVSTMEALRDAVAACGAEAVQAEIYRQSSDSTFTVKLENLS